MRVIFHYPAGPRLAEHLEALSAQGLEVEIVPPHDEAAFARALGSCEVLWHVLQPVTGAHISEAPHLRLIQKVGAGIDTIDVTAAKAAGIAVCNLPGTNSRAVAEHVIGLMLSVLRKIPLFDAEIRHGAGWAWPQARQDSLGELGGRTVGIVGYGAVAHQLVPLLRGFGTEIAYCDEREVPDAVGRRMDLGGLLAASDIVTLHVPLTDATRNMINRDSIRRMKTGAVLINAARGGLVDQDALAEALTSGKLAAAGLDTFAAEPVVPDNPLLALDTVVATPHVAWLTLETFERSIALMAENCRRLQAGEELLHRVA
jgi:phosphoglycerate dehydrogenase-like enzyme